MTLAETRLSRHAERRMQGRAIPQLVVDLILQFAEPKRVGRADRYVLNKQSKRRLEAYLGQLELKNSAKLFNAYVVIADDGTIVTTGYRTGRFKN